MRRRRPLDVWPAFADLMTVRAGVGLFTAVSLGRLMSPSEDLAVRNRELQRRLAELQEQLRKSAQDQQAREAEWARRRRALEGQIREAARNEQMFKAIQSAQSLIDDVSRGSGLSFAADQSLQFGDDLVSFALNGTVPRWQGDGRERLQRFCQAVSGQLSRSSGGEDARRLFVVQIEGHTDSVLCPGEPACNWRISSGRAAAFVALMRQPDYCPGGAELTLRPVGYADTRPLPGSPPTRRITVRLLPDYERMIRTQKVVLDSKGSSTRPLRNLNHKLRQDHFDFNGLLERVATRYKEESRATKKVTSY